MVIGFLLALVFSAEFLAALLWALILGLSFALLARQNIRVAEGVDILHEDIGIDVESRRELVMDTLGLGDAETTSDHTAHTPEPQPVAETTRSGDVEKARPTSLDAPRGDGPDDLTRISGIGPKLRDMLHGMGFYHFDQIANWTGAELAWVDDELDGFKGRASRDNWVAQAKELAGEERSTTA